MFGCVCVCLDVYMGVCMYVVCKFGCVYVWMLYVWMCVLMYVCVDVYECMYVWMGVCMNGCMYECVHDKWESGTQLNVPLKPSSSSAHFSYSCVRTE